MTLSMFLESNQSQAKSELSQYDYLMVCALQHFAKGEFKKAAIYHQNIVQTLGNLQELKNTKEQVDLTVKQINGDREMLELLRNLGVIE